MAYVRKTDDEWRIFVNYGSGWELECSEVSRKDARENIRLYRENCLYPVRLTGPHRVPKREQEFA